jgi:hypothetical protein
MMTWLILWVLYDCDNTPPLRKPSYRGTTPKNLGDRELVLARQFNIAELAKAT